MARRSKETAGIEAGGEGEGADKVEERGAGGDGIAGIESRLGDLVRLVGAPETRMVEAVKSGTPPEVLVARGALIATPRVVNDCVRLFGQAIDFVLNGPGEARERLRGVTPGLLAVGVYFLGELVSTERSQRERKRQVGHGRSNRSTVAAGERKAGVALRDQAARTLRGAAGTSERQGEVETATGTAETDEALADGIGDLAALLGRWLDGGDESLKARLGLAALDRGYAAELAAASGRVRAAAEASAVRPAATAISQGQLDYLDGLCLGVLGQLIHAFDAGHAIDPRIPRLLPIATRRIFQRNRRAAPALPVAIAAAPFAAANGHDPSPLQ